jgi:hypothetical protein
MPFPANPTLNDRYTVDNRVYIWNGSTWQFYKNAAVGGGAVTSVAGKIVAVTLDVTDVAGLEPSTGNKTQILQLGAASITFGSGGRGVAYGRVYLLQLAVRQRQRPALTELTGRNAQCPQLGSTTGTRSITRKSVYCSCTKFVSDRPRRHCCHRLSFCCHKS